jgi:hypothetical protein
MRLASLLGPAALAALAWIGAGVGLGLPTAVTIAGALLAGCGGVVAMAVCLAGMGQPEPIEHVEQERPRTVKAEPQKRFGRDEERTRPRGRVRAGDPPDRAA